MQLCGSLSILWHCLSLGLEWKLTFSSPVATAEFSTFAGILSAALVRLQQQTLKERERLFQIILEGQCTHSVFKHERGRWKSQCQSDTRWERLNQPLLDLNIKEAATSQGLQAACRNWKRQGNRFSHGASRGTTALLNILILAHSRPIGISDLQNFKIIYVFF